MIFEFVTVVATLVSLTIAIVALVFARRSASAADKTAVAAALSASADEVGVLHQAYSGHGAGKVKVYVALEDFYPRWRLQGSVDNEARNDWSPVTLDNLDHANFCRVFAPVRGILVNEDSRTIIIRNKFELFGGHTPLLSDPVPDPVLTGAR